MYIIERLKNEFPEKKLDLEIYDRFLRKYHDKKWVEKIFDDQKENFILVYTAFKDSNEIGSYNKYMCKYEQSLNDDFDFLSFFVEKFYPENYKENLTIEELKNIIKEKL